MIKSKHWILALFTREHILKQVVEHSLISKKMKFKIYSSYLFTYLGKTYSS